MYHMRILCTRHQVIHWARWVKKLKYGAKSPQLVYWAKWAKKFKIWYKASSGVSSHCKIYYMRTLCTIF
jgi:hypothetical protein